MNDIIIQVFNMIEHSSKLYEFSKLNNFYPVDVYLNVYKFKNMSPDLLIQLITQVIKMM